MTEYHDELYLQYETAKRSYYHAVRTRDEMFEDLRDTERTQRRENLIAIMEECVERRRRRCETLKNELKKSADTLDKVYYYTFVEKQKTSYTAKITGYTERQIYRHIKEIKDILRKSLDE